MVTTLSACIAPADALAAIQVIGESSWTTQPEYRIEDPVSGGGGFGEFSRLRVGLDGSRVVILEREIASGITPVWALSVWAVGGSRLLSMGADDVPAGPGPPRGIRAHSAGFQVRYGDRSMLYSYDGTEAAVTAVPPGAGAVYAAGPGRLCRAGGYPCLELQTGDTLKQDTIAILDIRHRGWFVGLRGESSRFPSAVSISQPFADHDLTWVDVEGGRVGVVRRNGGPGMVEVFELLATGDTVWDRRLALPPVSLAPEKAEEAIEATVSRLQRQGNAHGLTAADLRRIAEEAVHIPGHLPAVSRVVAAASGELWLKTPEVDNGLSVWYSIRRGDYDSEPRRVLMPSNLRLQDAFGDHVWGFSTPASGVRRIVGLRLRPPTEVPPGA